MALTPGNVKRTDDLTGDNFKTFADGSSNLLQGMVLGDESGNHAGIQGTPIIVDPNALAVRTDDTGTYIYVGWAPPGTLTSAAAWQIKRVDYSGDPSFITLWADGDAAFNNIWDNRGSLSYS